MSVTELGALGEFVSSLAVLATLLILVFQVRGARTEFSSQISRELRRHNSQDIQLPLREPRTLDVHIRAQRDFSTLEEGDQICWGVWLYSWITQTEDAWKMRQRGIPDLDFTDTMIGGVATVLRSDGGQVMWPRIRRWFDPGFSAEIEKAIEAGDERWLDVMLGTDQSETDTSS